MKNLFSGQNYDPGRITALFGQQNKSRKRRRTIYYCYDPNKYPEITKEELEGEEYEILEVGPGYKIVLYKGKIYVLYDA